MNYYTKTAAVPGWTTLVKLLSKSKALGSKGLNRVRTFADNHPYLTETGKAISVAVPSAGIGYLAGNGYSLLGAETPAPAPAPKDSTPAWLGGAVGAAGGAGAGVTAAHLAGGGALAKLLSGVGGGVAGAGIGDYIQRGNDSVVGQLLSKLKGKVTGGDKGGGGEKDSMTKKNSLAKKASPEAVQLALMLRQYPR